MLLAHANPTVTLSPMHPAIAPHRPGIAAICQRYGIRRLEVFGSAARATDFDPNRSDADFLVEFAPGTQSGLNTFFGANGKWGQTPIYL